MILSELRVAIYLDFQRSAVSGLYLWGFTLPKEIKVMHWCSMRAIQPLLYMYSNTYLRYFFWSNRHLPSWSNRHLHKITKISFSPTYHSLHVCSRQALLCARVAACRVPLVYYGRGPDCPIFWPNGDPLWDGQGCGPTSSSTHHHGSMYSYLTRSGSVVPK